MLSAATGKFNQPKIIHKLQWLRWMSTFCFSSGALWNNRHKMIFRAKKRFFLFRIYLLVTYGSNGHTIHKHKHTMERFGTHSLHKLHRFYSFPYVRCAMCGWSKIPHMTDWLVAAKTNIKPPFTFLFLLLFFSVFVFRSRLCSSVVWNAFY